MTAGLIATADLELQDMLYAVYCLDAENTSALREQLLKIHREYLDSWRDTIFFSGPLQTDDTSTALGSLFIVNVKDRSEAEAYIYNEPFYKAGIFRGVTITRMRKGRYNPDILDRP